MKITTLADLYLDQIHDMHSCETQLIRALPKMVKAAAHPDLKAGLTKHLEETTAQLERLNTILGELGKAPSRKVCEATVGLIKEGSDLIEATEEGEVRDTGIICAAQKIEHYEIASYGCLRAYATSLGRAQDATLLESTLKEEKHADTALSAVAKALNHANAMA